MHRAWLVIGSIVTVAALGLGTYHLIGLLAREEVVERTTVPAEGIELVDIGNDSGSVEVEGADVEEITVVAEITHGLRRTGHRVDVEGSTLVLRASCPALTTWCEVDYRLLVPAGVALVADVDNGRLIVRDVDGAVDVDGDNGSIDLVRLGGPVRASTDNGRLDAVGLRSPVVDADSDNGRVTLAFAEPPTSVRASSHNGRVDVILPDGPATYRVELDTRNGDTDIGVRTDPDSDRSVVAETDNGDVTVRYPTG